VVRVGPGPNQSTFRFSGVAYAKLLPIVRMWCAAADCRCEPLVAAVAVTVAVSHASELSAGLPTES